MYETAPQASNSTTRNTSTRTPPGRRRGSQFSLRIYGGTPAKVTWVRERRLGVHLQGEQIEIDSGTYKIIVAN